MEKNVLEYIDEDEVIKVAMDICKIPSFVPNETPVAQYLEKVMRENGIETEMQEVEEGRFQVLGRIKGTGEGPSLMYNGHCDISDLTMGQKRDPFKPTIEDGVLYAYGIYNMKGGVTAMVMAAVAIARAGIKLKGDLLIAAVLGEHQGGIGTKLLIDKGIISDYAIVPEPTNLEVKTATPGSIKLFVHIFGKSVHIGRMYEAENVDAIEKVCKVIAAIKKASLEKKFTYTPFPGKPGLPRMNANFILGGLGRPPSFARATCVSDFCSIIVNIRTVPGQTLETVKNDIENLLAELKSEDPELNYEIEGGAALYTDPFKITALPWMPPTNTPIDAHIVKVVSKNHGIVTGTEPVAGPSPKQMGSNDGGHLQFYAGTEVLTYGPGAPVAPDGSVDASNIVEDLINCTKILALTAVDICTRST